MFAAEIKKKRLWSRRLYYPRISTSPHGMLRPALAYFSVRRRKAAATSSAHGPLLPPHFCCSLSMSIVPRSECATSTLYQTGLILSRCRVLLHSLLPDKHGQTTSHVYILCLGRAFFDGVAEYETPWYLEDGNKIQALNILLPEAVAVETAGLSMMATMEMEVSCITQIFLSAIIDVSLHW